MTTTPPSSSSHCRMLAKLCPSAIAVWISGQRARICPALVAGFFPRRCARRCRVSVIHCCSAFVYCSLLATYSTVYDQFRHISTYFGNTIVGSTIFDVFRHSEARRDPPPPVRRPKTLVVEHKVGMRRWVSWWVFLLLQLWFGRDSFQWTCIPFGMRLRFCDYLRPKSPSPSPYR